jgi:hypothetical protein
LRPPDTEVIARPTEDSPDVGGKVGELVPRVLIGHPSGPHPVDRTAAVRVDETAQQAGRMIPNYVGLPLPQLDLAKVFHAGPVLRKQARPMLPARVNLHAAILTPPGANATLDSHGRHRLPCLTENPWIAGIEVHAESEHSTGALDDVAVPR